MEIYLKKLTSSRKSDTQNPRLYHRGRPKKFLLLSEAHVFTENADSFATWPWKWCRCTFSVKCKFIRISTHQIPISQELWNVEILHHLNAWTLSESWHFSKRSNSHYDEHKSIENCSIIKKSNNFKFTANFFLCEFLHFIHFRWWKIITRWIYLFYANWIKIRQRISDNSMKIRIFNLELYEKIVWMKPWNFF